MSIIPDAIDITESVDGRWMVLCRGYQIGGDVDRSGSGNLTFDTKQEAEAYALDWWATT
jgi:hypothetical protein